MSTHCFICGGPDNWIGSKEIEHDEMIDVKAFPEYEKKKIWEKAMHATCFLRAIRRVGFHGQEVIFLEKTDYENDDFGGIKKFIDKQKKEAEEY